jgi:hypothetical protein
VTWTRITNPEQAEGQLPVWFGTRMLGLRGRFGLVLTTGDVLRITCITALHESPHGVILLDVLLDHAGVRSTGRNGLAALICCNHALTRR